MASGSRARDLPAHAAAGGIAKGLRDPTLQGLAASRRRLCPLSSDVMRRASANRRVAIGMAIEEADLKRGCVRFERTDENVPRAALVVR